MTKNLYYFVGHHSKVIISFCLITLVILVSLSACVTTATLPSGSSLRLLGVQDIPGTSFDTVNLPTDQDYILVLTTKTSGLLGATGGITFYLSQGPILTSPSDSLVTIKPLGKRVKSKQFLSWYYLLSADRSAVGKEVHVEMQISYTYLHTFPLGKRKGGPFINREKFTISIVTPQFVYKQMENWNKDVLLIQNLPKGAEISRELGNITISPTVNWISQNENLDKLKKKAFEMGANVITNLKFIAAQPVFHRSHGFSADALIVE